MDDEVVTQLDEGVCWTALSEADFGRIAVCAAGQVDVFPINFVVDGRMILFRTAPGSKLLSLTAHPEVALEIDGFDDRSAWSVVVKGLAERVELQSEIDEAERLGLRPWIPTLKYRWVRLIPTDVTGLSFLRSPEPERF